MNYIACFDLGRTICTIYNNNTLIFSDDELSAILKPHARLMLASDNQDISELNDIHNIRRVLADALVFIHTMCTEYRHQDLLTMKYETWQKFFETCFTDIICNNSDEQVRQLARQLEMNTYVYGAYYGAYQPLTLNIQPKERFVKYFTVALVCILILA